jgi:hypothetical protein
LCQLHFQFGDAGEEELVLREQLVNPSTQLEHQRLQAVGIERINRHGRTPELESVRRLALNAPPMSQNRRRALARSRLDRDCDARHLWDAMRERLHKFSLSLQPEKTRLIAFGRHGQLGVPGAGLVNLRPLLQAFPRQSQHES